MDTTMTKPRSLQETVRAFLERTGMKKAELVRRSKVSQSTIDNVLDGKSHEDITEYRLREAMATFIEEIAPLYGDVGDDPEVTEAAQRIARKAKKHR